MTIGAYTDKVHLDLDKDDPARLVVETRKIISEHNNLDLDQLEWFDPMPYAQNLFIHLEHNDLIYFVWGLTCYPLLTQVDYQEQINFIYAAMERGVQVLQRTKELVKKIRDVREGYDSTDGSDSVFETEEQRRDAKAELDQRRRDCSKDAEELRKQVYGNDLNRIVATFNATKDKIKLKKV